MSGRSGPGATRTARPASTLFRALATLTALDRAVVVLRYWDDLSAAETAALVGLSPGAVRVRSMRVLARLRQTLTTLYAVDTPGDRS